MPRSVLITGAAAGIGRATALRFAREGWLVGAFDIDVDGLASLATAVEPLPGTLVTGTLDVRDATSWQTALDGFAAETGGSLDVLVNNAGIIQIGSFSDLPLERQQAVVDVNVKGVVNGCHLARPYLQPGSHVVNLASASAIYGQPGMAIYSATKFAVRGLSEALDLEWSREGITVTALWPLFADTSMVWGHDFPALRRLKVSLTPDDVAESVYAAATSGHGLLGGIHRGVGTKARTLLALSGVTPSWANRMLNRLIST
ncbi:NAD(P)-dependent dehydrogenase (short-subunit alcohol dehydrogenase family) [Nocardioides luteus]|uniref:Short-chain dehydrogenase n=1 Tax=Nocardioides luteus TaxID=1844 RepID=A0ABQ5T1F7_9ACTN|nr:SDR family oxidoreductase [Nocardioides luteus]MDR7310566.1 NAD(P)-dependent dehydrogenase (short-subunit alcohol dehydrogenase family) [Nocardioides luteus]GGR41993.1 short-chain dehydrogenase [Nocardioides luteus]GLJ69653.1 short-chain dehydrogenase [Nocardioides luteus]